jgi:hypothetical protein
VSDFDELVDGEGLAPDEDARLRRVHELLIQAGPPPDLPPALADAPDPEDEDAEIVQFPLLPRRRWAVAAVAAAALALAFFGAGFLFGHSKAPTEALKVDHVIPMHGVAARGVPNALAVLRVSTKDSVGNWPMELEITGLPRLSQRASYYELWLTKKHRPVEPCGAFRVQAKTTTVRFTVPYDLTGVDGWVITTQPNTSAPPGPVLVTT